MTTLLPPLLNLRYSRMQAWRVSNWSGASAATISRCGKACHPISSRVYIHPSASIGTQVFSTKPRPSSSAPLRDPAREVTSLQNVTIGRDETGQKPDAQKEIGRGRLSQRVG